MHSRDVGVSVSCQKPGPTMAPKADVKGRTSPGLTCPSSYCFVNQPFLKFSRSGCKKGERRDQRGGWKRPCPADNSSSLKKHSAAIEETVKLDHYTAWS